MKNATPPSQPNRQPSSPLPDSARDWSLMDASPDAVVVVDQKGRVRDWNAAAEMIFGYRRENAVGRDIASLIIPGVRRGLREDLGRFLKLGTSEFVGQIRELPAVRSDGLEVTVELLVLLIPGPGEAAFLLQLRDVTERERKMAAYVDFYLKMQIYHQGTARTMAALTRDLDIANAIQRAVLPLADPTLSRWDIALRYEFAQEVGGDFCMFVEDSQRFNVVVGDVSGKGVPAALTSTSITHLLPWLLRLHPPQAALRDLNKDLKALLPTEHFATLVMAEFDIASGSVVLWNAGHPAAIHWSAETGAIRYSELANPLLGVLSEWDGKPEPWRLKAGDAMVLCTDGIFEARDGKGEQFGHENCASAIARVGAGTSAQIAEALLEEVHAWGTLADDATLVVCKFRGD